MNVDYDHSQNLRTTGGNRAARAFPNHMLVSPQLATPLIARRSAYRHRTARLRVLHFASVINRHDFIDTIVRHLDRSRFFPMACTFSKTSNIQTTDYEGKIPNFSLEVTGKRAYGQAIFRLSSILREQEVDILHAHHYHEALIGIVAAAMVTGCRVIVGRHYHDEIYLLPQSLRRSLYLALEGVVNRSAKAIVVPSSVIRKLMVEEQHVQQEKIQVIPYGFEFNAQKYKRCARQEMENILTEFAIPQGRFVFGNFGRHHKWKGQEALLRAYADFVKQYLDTTLLMVGDGPDGASLRRLAEELGLLRSGMVIFAGWRRDAWRILEAVNVVVHPTLHEALPQLMVEAMAKAKPLIITNVSGACDHARHLENAYVISEVNHRSIYAGLAWMYHNRAASQVLAERASVYIRSELSIERIIPRFEELYERVAC
jgi:glycosyltransferase involved in cell wall biosynthesis